MIVGYDNRLSLIHIFRTGEDVKQYTDNKKASGHWPDAFFMQFTGPLRGTIAVFMSEGAIIEEGSPADLFDHPQSERLQSFLAKVL